MCHLPTMGQMVYLCAAVAHFIDRCGDVALCISYLEQLIDAVILEGGDM